MAIPDRIERTAEFAHPPAKVWAALTTAEGLGSWFGDSAAIDLRPGGPAEVRWDGGYLADLTVERVEEPTVFGFAWKMPGLPDDEPYHTHVEFTLEPIATGTRLHVVETGFARMPAPIADNEFTGHAQGWPKELDDLAGYLDAA
ncbi:SRPBCC domain-containing protein [Amycolatopsis silviterrae]|uniref:SRPBCC domain-containing protein n=1 Tax=Amycolatopsis silviterrae TaxID=1656914 RepID=A0ABW5H3G2_9PSEU